MILIENNQVKVVFGTSERAGVLLGVKAGCLTIGDVPEDINLKIGDQTKAEVSEPSVIFSFQDTKSIDALINRLQRVKELTLYPYGVGPLAS